MRVVLLDIDGTLLDSVAAHAAAWSDALSEFRRGVSPPQIRPLVGMGGDKVVPILTGLSAESDESLAIAQRRGEIFRERYLPGVKAFPYVRDLLSALRDRGSRLVVATSASETDMDALLDRAGVADLIDGRVSGDDVERSKPDPDIIVAALRRFDVPPREAVLIGDTPYDVEAARRAGVPAIAMRSSGWTDDTLQEAAAIFADPAELLGHVDLLFAPEPTIVRDAPSVADVMTCAVRGCSIDDAVATVLQRMWDDDLGAVPVLDRDRVLAGVLTDRDVAMAMHLSGRAAADLSLRTLIQAPVATCRPTHSVYAALAIMRARQVHRLAVLDAANGVVGIVSLTDCARAAADPAGDTCALARRVCVALAAIRAPRPRTDA